MIRFLLNLYMFIIIADAILSYMPQYHNEDWAKIIKKLANYSLNPIRKILPANDLPVDIAPLIVILILQIIPALW